MIPLCSISPSIADSSIWSGTGAPISSMTFRPEASPTFPWGASIDPRLMTRAAIKYAAPEFVPSPVAVIEPSFINCAVLFPSNR